MEQMRKFDREMIQQTLRSLQDQYDPIYGGFASGPNQLKFPTQLRFLMALAMLRNPRTADRMERIPRKRTPQRIEGFR